MEIPMDLFRLLLMGLEIALINIEYTILKKPTQSRWLFLLNTLKSITNTVKSLDKSASVCYIKIVDVKQYTSLKNILKF